MTQNQLADYTSTNHPAQTKYTPAVNGGQSQSAILYKRIGSTTYRVRVHFSDTGTETISDKILRMVKREAVGE